MKVLSIKQPWASLIIYGYKDYEFRSWKTKYRGKFLIHASLDCEKKYIEMFKHLNIPFETGKIIGEVDLLDCLEVTNTLEQELIKKNKLVYGQSTNRGGYAWKIESPITYDNPIKINGKLGLWEYQKDPKME